MSKTIRRGSKVSKVYITRDKDRKNKDRVRAIWTQDQGES